MAITDKLRRNIEGAEQLYGRECQRLRAIADRIDDEHKKAMDDSYRDGYQEGKRDGDDEWYEEHESYLEEHGWYQVLDADKQVIYADDELFSSDGVSRGRVMAIGVGKRAGYVWTLPENGMISISHLTRDLHHHHVPTIEDVLHEFICDHEEGVRDESDLIAEYAAKLRLAGDES